VTAAIATTAVGNRSCRGSGITAHLLDGFADNAATQLSRSAQRVGQDERLAVAVVSRAFKAGVDAGDARGDHTRL
jgi:hypothetical protein